MPNNYKPRTIREMSEPERAWMGAMVEGEGCISVAQYRGHTAVRFQVTTTGPETLSAFFRIAGGGNLRIDIPGATRSRTGRKVKYNWTLDSRADVLAFARQILPYLADKQDYLKKTIQMLELEELTEFQALTEAA